MANALYPLWKTAIMDNAAESSLSLNNTTNGPYVALIDTGVYTYNATHDMWDDASAGNIGVAGGMNLGSPTTGATAGTFDAANVTFSTVTGATVEALIIYRHNSGAAGTWRLVCYLDTGITGLTLTPNGGDVSIAWAADGIFSL